jgi:hypothetical protein
LCNSRNSLSKHKITKEQENRVKKPASMPLAPMVEKHRDLGLIGLTEEVNIRRVPSFRWGTDPLLKMGVHKEGEDVGGD